MFSNFDSIYAMFVRSVIPCDVVQLVMAENVQVQEHSMKHDEDNA